MCNSKAKGSGFEREIARKLTMWLTGQDKELYWWRSPNSGGVSTVSQINTEISGDLVALKPESIAINRLFNWELKTGYEGASFDLHLKCNKNEDLRVFWEQSVRDAKRADKEPVVIFRKKRMPNIWCGISENIFNKFYDKLKENRIILLTWGKEFSLQPVIFMNFEDFLNTITPEDLL